MALSANAARALEQVKNGLYMLYGADYFTDDEWIKIDYLLHKGNYVLTSGPRDVVHDEELISFGDSKDETEPAHIQTSSIQTVNPSDKDIMVVSEAQIPSPSSSEGEDSHFNQDEATNATSVEPSSDEETTPNVSSDADVAPMLDFSEPTITAVTEIPPPKPQPLPQTSNGLPPGITQEQLDEARLMQAAMTKASQKSHAKSKRAEVSLAESRWAEDSLPEETTIEEVYPSPNPSERETRITSWASEVNAQQISAPEIVSQAPIQEPIDPKALAAAEFIKVHGREPKSLNDFYQPKNPAHYSQRSISVASASTAKTAKTTPTTQVTPQKIMKISPGTTYIAQNAQTKIHGSDLRLDIQARDHIKAIKYVSGIMWVGTNQRTKLTGQFSEDIFKKAAPSQKPDPAKIVRSATVAPGMTSSSIRNVLENVEWTNAAEWNEVPTKPKVTSAPTPVRPALGGLSSSRFSVLANTAESKSQVPTQTGLTLEMKKEFGKMVDEKVDEILKARGMASTPVPTGPSRSRTLNETLKPVPPKKNTCWFWATNKGCRFTADECRDLHGYLPTAAGEPTNLHMGKPTWGALADSSTSVGHVDPDAFTVPEFGTSSPNTPEQKKLMTCWYWAQNGNCGWSAEDCKYLHEHTGKGVAPRPWKKIPSWGAHTWRRGKDSEIGADDAATVNGDASVAEWGGTENEDAASGDLVLEEVNADDSTSIAGWGVIGDGGAGGWGRDTPVQDSASGWGGSEDRYKPPHIKALEQQAMIQAVGW